jgi:hypothetical protein
MKSHLALIAGLVLTSAAGITPDISEASGQGYDRTDPRNCPPRGDPRRTACLERMVRDGKPDIDRDTAYLNSLNQSMRKACDTAQVADSAARVARGMPPGHPVRAVGRVWSSARALADFALGQHRECEKLRRELRGR